MAALATDFPFAKDLKDLHLVYDYNVQDAHGNPEKWRYEIWFFSEASHWENAQAALGDKRNPADLERWRGLARIGIQTDRHMLPEQADIVDVFRVSPTFYRHKLQMFSRLRTPVLKNSGSTARDHLASERTFLSWLRTGLGFVALGIAVERFSQFELVPPSPAPLADKGTSEDQKDKSEDLVLGLLATGSGSIVYGTTRYFSNMRMLEKGLYKPSFYGAAGLSVAVVGLTGAAYWEIVRSKRKEKD
ncbi:MAG: hypothetical protein ASARMPRED_007350 [Alectoria sarmentosa]|nr:MAG: hypothetical protein ASARMPRED_007350 [Alectoria sarmentosa]